MAEIEASLLAKVHDAAGVHDQPVLIGFLRSRKRRIGTLIEATSGQSLKELKREVKKKGGKKIKVYKEIKTIYAEMPVDKVTDLASVSCAQKVYDAEGDVKLTLNQSVPLIMGVGKWQLPYRVKGKKLEGTRIKVAVIDSGIDTKHPDFQGRIARRKNFSRGRRNKGTEHGTHVAGIIAGSGKASGYRYTGVAPKVKLYDAKVFMNSATPTTRNAVVEATLWAVKKNVHVINMSFGDHQGCSDGTCILCKTADYAASQGITVVAAAGNAGPAEDTISCPGNAERVVTVGATTKTSPTMVLGFSSRGSLRQTTKPDVVAPGDKIVAPQPKRQYTAMSGTSMAAPHVTGLVALLYQSGQYVNGKERMTPAELKQTLKQGSIDLGEHSTAQGNGLVNFENELATMQQPRKRSRFLRKKKQFPQSANQVSQPEAAEIEPSTCPAVMNMFCPHYDKHTCNEIYETCIHYQAVNQVKVLQKIKECHDGLPKHFTPEIFTEDFPAIPTYTKTTNLTEKVVGTISGQPISEVTVSERKNSAITSTKGNFKLRNVPKETIPVNISGEHIYPRRIIVNTNTSHSVRIDAIEQKSKFNLRFYRELARGNHPHEKNMFPIYRRIHPKAPTFYIDTNASSTLDGKITKGTKNKIHHAIAQILPVFSGNLYRTARIKVRKFSHDEYTFDAIPNNSIVISFDDTMYLQQMLGITFLDPTSLSNYIVNKVLIFIVNYADFLKNISREELVAHEVGHGFGYCHTSALPSIMDKYGILPKELFSEHDKLHMKVMYSRPVGNTDIDNDPILPKKMLINPAGRHIFIDKWETPPLSPKLQKRLQTLPGLTYKFLEEAGVTI